MYLRQTRHRFMRQALATTLAAMTCGTTYAAREQIWTDAPPEPSRAPTNQTTRDPHEPSRFRRVTLSDRQSAPPETGARKRRAAPEETFDLPLPDGGTSQFTVIDSGVIPASIAAQIPGLRSLVGHDEAGRTARIDIDSHGTVDASVTDSTGSWLVSPEQRATPQAGRTPARIGYRVYRRADAPAPASFDETPLEPEASKQVHVTMSDGLGTTYPALRAGGQPLRTFRIAISATSSYVAAMGGTVEGGLAGVTRMVNRLNEIFENDLGVRFVLAEGSEKLIFADKASDPFSDIDTSMDLLYRQVSVVAKTLPRDSYDIGHVVHASDGEGGGIGGLGNSCRMIEALPAHAAPGTVTVEMAMAASTDKAGGVSIMDTPYGDTFHVGVVAHELGHQLGADHTFNDDTEARSARSAFEPGSGSTIMTYAGLTETDIATHTDPYFHTQSIQQIRAWLDSHGGSCASERSNPVRPPYLDIGQGVLFTVPARTAFKLHGELQFAQPGARPTYTFEQMDLGPPQTTRRLADIGSGPLFRSRPPTRLDSQFFPSMNVLFGKEPLNLGDTWPTTNRTLRFRLTARDNLGPYAHVVGGDIAVRVVNTGSSFRLVAPAAGSTVNMKKGMEVRWQVSGTDKPPIDCQSVNIALAGNDEALATLSKNTPNSGTFFAPAAMLREVRGESHGKIPATSRHARLIVSCTNPAAPFLAVSQGTFSYR